MSLSYVPGTVQLLVPPNVANELTQHYHCDGCKFRYALLGTAYFCPSCGKPSTFATIEESLNLLRTFQHKVDAIKVALESVYKPEETGKLLALMIEEHFCKVVSVLQKHTNGIVDVEYLAKTSDAHYSVGQRIIVRPNDLGAFLDVAAVFIKVTSKNYS